MRPTILLPLLTLPLALATKTPHLLRATAIVTNAHNNSALQCWQLTHPFSVSTAPGTAGAATLALENYTDVVYTVLPAHFNGGVHNAPFKQLVVFLSGLANVSLPHSSDFAVVHGGKNGVIVAVDTSGTGHITEYPSGERTVSLQMPFAGGVVPGHKVLHEGPCTGAQIESD